MYEETLFHLALEQPAAERPAFLDKMCGDDRALLQRVEALLHAHDNPGDFLAQPAVPQGQTVDEPRLAERPGSRIGPYKLLQQIGEGGMGVVFMAEQTEPVRRRVALKVVKPGLDTRQVVARFEAERQALALMDHPNIAKVLDAGATESGRLYFVMELVQGLLPHQESATGCQVPHTCAKFGTHPMSVDRHPIVAVPCQLPHVGQLARTLGGLANMLIHVIRDIPLALMFAHPLCAFPQVPRNHRG